MKFLGSDFFLIAKFIIAIVKAMIQIFGDDEDKQQMNNHMSKTIDAINVTDNNSR